MRDRDEPAAPKRPPLPEWLPVATVLAAGAILAVAAAVVASAQHADDLERALEGRAREARTAIERRLALSGESLFGIRGLFGGRPVDRSRFRAYLAAGGTLERVSGLQALSFNRRLRPSEVAAFERRVRAETVSPGGNPAFAVRPAPEGGRDLIVVDFLEPFEGNEPAFGFDIASDPARRAAVVEARDSGAVTATAPITLVQEGQQRRGFLVILPLYATGDIPTTAPARRRHFIGTATAVFRAGDLLESVVGVDPVVRVEEIYDVGLTVASEPSSIAASGALYDQDPDVSALQPQSLPRPYRFIDLNAGTRRWRVLIVPGERFDRGLPAGLLAGGFTGLVALLLAAVVYSLSRTRHQALLLAERMTQGVREREELLREQAEELSRSNEELDQFAQIVSHDLQEPARSMANFAELLAGRLGEGLDETSHVMLERIVDGSERMSDLIRDLLAYARVGSQDLEVEQVDLNVVLAQTLSDLSAQVAQAGARVGSTELPTVTADPVQAGRLLLNLISNAIKFRSESSPDVHLSARRRGDFWEVSVRDNGIGLDEEYAEQIFEPFRRLHPRDRYPGTGMGLAVCRRIVRRHGGEISASGALGKGTVITFTLPAAG